MEIRLKILIILSLIILSGIFPFFNYAHADTVIEMTQKSYTPQNLEIKRGDTVIFKNTGDEDSWPASNIHPTHEIYSEFDPRKPITPGNSWQFTFEKSGMWKYHDHLYPNITGTITVKDSSATDSSDNSLKNKLIQLSDSVRKFFTMVFNIFNRDSDSSFVDIEENSKDIFHNEELLRSYVKKFGPTKTVKRLHELSFEFGSCHDTAHKAGHFSYEILEEKAFKECSSECHSGCYHGATEAYFKDHGTENLSKNLNTLCGNELNGFFSHQCIHGIGHGLMAWASYDIFEALKSCDLLDKRPDSCWTGVFMENIVGGLTDKSSAHFTKYLSDDPQYPCDIVDNKYKVSCYFLQTSRMVQLFHHDFSKVATACLEAPTDYQNSCFSSMGRDVGGSFRKDPRGAIKACSYAPIGHLRTACLLGAVQDTFWDPSGQDDAISFCKLLLNKGEKDACYGTIIPRAHEVLLSEKDVEIFCNKTEEEYRTRCPK